jgi:hypothetical protein
LENRISLLSLGQRYLDRALLRCFKVEGIGYTIVDFLSQSYGRRNVPGWIYLLGAAISVAGAISVKEITKKRKALKSVTEQKLLVCALHARILSVEDRIDVEYRAVLKKDLIGYRVSIDTGKDGNVEVVADVSKTTLNEIADFLRAETKFVLEDFT